ncbi:hypothetical protein DPMN_045922 [Dreissena polymorpha]|uniref:Uncharacterized protein n=1 Tax=Dreissena polymorpha TaxID=45954 RepID=A0A9D4D6Y4_DREPO|nr:hypothetical protein DPMN_045922 [Dreissena polymorpha]
MWHNSKYYSIEVKYKKNDSKGKQKLNILWENTTASQFTVNPESDSTINIPNSPSENASLCSPGGVSEQASDEHLPLLDSDSLPFVAS